MTHEVISNPDTEPFMPDEVGVVTGMKEAAAQADLTRDQSRAISNTLAQGAGISLLGSMVGRMADMIAQILLARTLGPDMFGLYAVGSAFVILGGSLVPLGLDKGIIKFASAYWQRDAKSLRYVVNRGILLSAIIAITTSVLMFVLAPWLGNTVFGKPELVTVFRYFAPSLGLNALLTVVAAATTISLRMHYNVYTQTLGQPLTNLLFMVAAFALGYRLNGANLAFVLSFAVSTVLALIYIRRVIKLADTTTPPDAAPMPMSSTGASFMWELIAFSLPVSFAGVFAILISRVDSLIIGALLPEALVGIYQSVSQVSIAFTLGLVSFYAIIRPLVSNLYAVGDIRQIEHIYRISTKWGFYMIFPLFLMTLILPTEIISIVFGHDYISGALPLAILAVGQFANGITGANALILIMTGRQRQWFIISLLVFVINIVLGIVLTKYFGLVGAALATTASVTVMNFWGVVLLRQELNIWPYDRRYLKGVLAGGVALLLPLGIKLLHIDLGLIGVILSFAGTYLLFLGILLVQGIDPEDKDILQLVEQSLTRILKPLRKAA
jgi:O-antigen/teichoic acid export membrane protein